MQTYTQCHKLRVRAYFFAVGISGIVHCQFWEHPTLWRAEVALCVCSGRRSPETPDQREFVKKFVHELEEMKLK